MPSKQCVVVDCDTSYKDKITLRHRFPRDEPTFSVWVERSGNQKLLELPMNDVYKRFIMCDKHFAPSCKSPGCRKLITNSVPTLNLPHYNDLEDDNDSMSIEIVTDDFYEDTNQQMSTESINCIISSDIDVELYADYNDLEDDTDNMSIEIVTNDFCEDTNRQISNESINCIKSSDIDVELNADYNDLEDDTDNMSIEIVTNDFCEDTNRKISNESINCIKSSDIDVELNAGIDGTFKMVPRSPP